MYVQFWNTVFVKKDKFSLTAFISSIQLHHELYYNSFFWESIMKKLWWFLISENCT